MKFFILRALVLFFTWKMFSTVCFGHSGNNNQKKEVVSINLALDSISKIFEYFPTDLIRIRKGAILLENLNQIFHNQTQSFNSKKTDYFLITQAAREEISIHPLPQPLDPAFTTKSELKEFFLELRNDALISNEIFQLLDDYFVKGRVTGKKIGVTLHGGLILGGAIGVFFGIIENALGVKYTIFFPSKDLHFPSLGVGITTELSQFRWDQSIHSVICSAPMNFGIGMGVIINRTIYCRGGGFFIGPLISGSFLGGRSEYPVKLVKVRKKRDFKMLRKRLGLIHVPPSKTAGT